MSFYGTRWPNPTYNLTCDGMTIECSKEEKVLDIAIDDKLNFTPHLGNIIKKGNQKLHALRGVKCYMDVICYMNKTIF